MIRPSDWCFICGLVSARAERLMDRRAVLGVLNAASSEERRNSLRASLLFADAPPSDASLDEVSDRFERAVRAIAHSAPDNRIGDLVLLDRPWQAFRSFARAKVGGRAEAPTGSRPPSANDLDAIFHECWEGRVDDPRLQPFADGAEAMRAAVAGETDVPGMVDRVADAHEAASLRRAAAALGSETLSDWIAILTRLRAGLVVTRAWALGWDVQKFAAPWQAAGMDQPELKELISAGSEQLPAAWDRLGLPNAAEALRAADPSATLARVIDDRITALAGEARGMPFGPERVFAFLWGLRREALNLSIALTAAVNGIPEDRAASELRA